MNYEFLKDLTEKELDELEKEVKKEINNRQPKKKYVMYQYDCHNAGNSNYHFTKYAHWAKLVDDIDMSKSDKSAFVGNFLEVRNQNVVPLNSIVVECCGNTLKCYKMTNQGKKLIVLGGTGLMVDFIMSVQQEL